MFSLHKKTIAIVVLTILAIIYMVPVFAQTATSDVCADKDNTMCWPQKMCQDKGGNFATTADSKKVCGAIADCYKKNYPKMSQEALNNYNSLGYCYTKPAAVNLQIPIGELKQSATFTQYIPAVYNYLVAIVSIVAIVMIMVGGLQYLTAGGNPSAITSAKERILGAVIGLFLTFGSYILLQTINPALVALKMPDIKMVRTSALTKEEACAGKPREATLGQKCNNSCDCKQGKCIPIEAGVLEQMIKGVGYGTAAAMSLWTLGGGSIASGAKTVLIMVKKGTEAALKLTKILAPYAVSTVVNHPIATAVAGYALFSAPAGQPDQPGICIVEANKNVSTGAWCEKDEHCFSGKCVCMPGLSGPGLSKMEGAKCFGVCGGGGNGSPCECAQSDVCTDSGGCDAGLKCIDSSKGTMSKTCTDFKIDSHCNPKLPKEGGCWTNYDKPARCVDVFLGTPGATSFLCKPVIGKITNETVCAGDADCGFTGRFGDWRCVFGLCSNGGEDANCYTPNYPCQQGKFTCAFWFSDAKKWIVDTGDEKDYIKNAQLRGEWLLVRDKPSQHLICISSDAADLASPN